ncbi:MAG: hypothetical protein A2W85_05720 [Bacteroidetes bacterium GWF2_41_31]|nr:MAG: hypothetical protein A2W85_05720 [Bacteroidetes bacterium GWF2_41_31]
MENKVHSLKETARFAGLMYLIWIITAIYGLIYVQTKTIMHGDAVATSVKMLANEFIFRTGIINGILSSIVWILIGMTLYRLFKHINKGQAIQLPASNIKETNVYY